MKKKLIVLPILLAISSQIFPGKARPITVKNKTGGNLTVSVNNARMKNVEDSAEVYVPVKPKTFKFTWKAEGEVKKFFFRSDEGPEYPITKELTNSANLKTIEVYHSGIIKLFSDKKMIYYYQKQPDGPILK